MSTKSSKLGFRAFFNHISRYRTDGCAVLAYYNFGAFWEKKFLKVFVSERPLIPFLVSSFSLVEAKVTALTRQPSVPKSSRFHPCISILSAPVKLNFLRKIDKKGGDNSLILFYNLGSSMPTKFWKMELLRLLYNIFRIIGGKVASDIIPAFYICNCISLLHILLKILHKNLCKIYIRSCLRSCIRSYIRSDQWFSTKNLYKILRNILYKILCS